MEGSAGMASNLIILALQAPPAGFSVFAGFFIFKTIFAMFNPPTDRIAGKNVDFMATCLCDSIFPDAAKNAVQILRHFGAAVALPEDQTCCGQPAFNSGDFASARRVLRSAMRAFSAGAGPIVVPSASCAAMLYHSSKIAFRDSDEAERAAVDAFARRVWEFCDYLANVLGVGKIPGELDAKIAVHNSCHGRGGGTPAALKKLLGSIDGVELVEFDGSEDCCGFGGTFSVVFPQLSSEMGEKKVRAIAAAEPDIVCAADTSCLMHQRGIAGRLGIKYKTMHAAEVFFAAMKNGGIFR